jgi:hypothetical protein
MLKDGFAVVPSLIETPKVGKGEKCSCLVFRRVDLPKMYFAMVSITGMAGRARRGGETVGRKKAHDPLLHENVNP